MGKEEGTKQGTDKKAQLGFWDVVFHGVLVLLLFFGLQYGLNYFQYDLEFQIILEFMKVSFDFLKVFLWPLVVVFSLWFLRSGWEEILRAIAKKIEQFKGKKGNELFFETAEEKAEKQTKKMEEEQKEKENKQGEGPTSESDFFEKVFWGKENFTL